MMRTKRFAMVEFKNNNNKKKYTYVVFARYNKELP